MKRLTLIITFLIGTYLSVQAQDPFFDLPGEEISKTEMQLLIMSKIFGQQLDKNEYEAEFAELDRVATPIMQKTKLPQNQSSAYVSVVYPTLTVGRLAGVTPELALSVDQFGNPKVIESSSTKEKSSVSLSLEQRNILQAWITLNHIDTH
ncbi:MAG: hypothetical protein AAGJ93_03700 [Bacteroidota bacterium]